MMKPTVPHKRDSGDSSISSSNCPESWMGFCDSDDESDESKGIGRKGTSALPYKTNIKLKCLKTPAPFGTAVKDQHMLELIPRIPASGIIRFKLSERIYTKSSCEVSHKLIPYIDHKGRIYPEHPLGAWKCSSKQFMNTITSTVIKRIYAYYRRKYRDQFRKYGPGQQLLLQVAVLHSILQNNYKLNRWLSIRRFGDLRKVLYYEIKNMENNNKFLFDQIFLPGNISWLQSHTRSPGYCKSSPKLIARSCTSPNLEMHKILDKFTLPYKPYGLRVVIDNQKGLAEMTRNGHFLLNPSEKVIVTALKRVSSLSVFRKL